MKWPSWLSRHLGSPVFSDAGLQESGWVVATLVRMGRIQKETGNLWKMLNGLREL